MVRLRVIPDATALCGDDPPVMPFLVVYASRHGATEAIAARIATRLVDSGASVELRRVDEIETLRRLRRGHSRRTGV